MDAQLRLAHLYPEQMNIYGDRGNIIALQQRCAWRGIQLSVEPVVLGGTYDWTAFDIAFFGGGQDSGQALIASDFVARQGPALRAAINDGLVMLAICGGYQLLGHYFLTHANEKLPGIGALDVHTVGGGTRMIGNIVVEAKVDQRPKTKDQSPAGDVGTLNNTMQSTGQRSSSVFGLWSPTRLVGFENHSGRTYLGPGVQPLGRVLVGSGNNGEDGTEGAVYGNAYGCYMHGSLLPKNPQLADHLITLALARRGLPSTLAPLPDSTELTAQRTMIERLMNI